MEELKQKYLFISIKGGPWGKWGVGFYRKNMTIMEAWEEADNFILNNKHCQVEPGAYVESVKPVKTYPAPYYPGDGSGPIMLDLTSLGEMPRGFDGNCAFCGGDPLAEGTDASDHIINYYRRNPSAETCPMCEGRPT